MPEPKKKQSDADFLFQSAPEHIRKLHEASKKLRRGVERSIWWDANKRKPL